MNRRLSVLLVALAIAAAPIALEACRISCAPVAQPSCHHTARTGTTWSPGAVPCDHRDTLTSLSVATDRPDTVASAPVRVVAADLSDTIGRTIRRASRVDPDCGRLDLRRSVALRI